MSKDVKEIIQALENCYLGGDICEHNFYEDIVYEFKAKYKKPFKYDQGASKGVLIFENLGLVVKIPFCGNYCDGDEYDEEIDTYYGDDFEYFCGAEGDNGWDYCAVEAERYRLAKKDGLKKCFAGTGLVTEIQGHPIYIQEYATMYDYGKSSNHTKEDTDSVHQICKDNSYYCFNEEWLSDLFNYFGEETFNNFMNFINFVGINDLHNGNIGYIKGRPVLVDYSGWGD